MIFQYWSIRQFSVTQTLFPIFHIHHIGTLTEDVTKLYPYIAEISVKLLSLHIQEFQ